MKLKTRFRNFVRILGYDIAKYDPESYPFARRKDILDKFGINVVLDVGANIGQYAKELRSIGFKGKIISFEPLSFAFKSLKESAVTDGSWQVQNCALGSIEGKAILNVSGNPASSSLLDMLPSHIKSDPESQYVGQEEISVKRLDSIFTSLCHPQDRVYLKIDVQGFEKEVIKGAEHSLQAIAIVQREMSLTPLYKDELLFSDMCQLLSQYGYFLIAIESGFQDKATGQLLQIDGIFRRA